MSELIENIKKYSSKIINDYFLNKKTLNLGVSFKEDRTIVTRIDIEISNKVKSLIPKNYTFYSEEDFNELSFPVAVLDPIDGTRELSKGINECSVSLAMMNSSVISDPLNEVLVYNPFTSFSAQTTSKQTPPFQYYETPLHGFVSRSEYKKGFYKSSSEIIISPKGSIAYKLGLLSQGVCDFVITKRPKNIWDIAAGTILCQRAGISMFIEGKKIEALDKPLYQSPIIWCRDEIYEQITKHLDS